MCQPTLKRSFLNIKLQEKDGDMQSCHQIDEEEVLDIDESVTILELRWKPKTWLKFSFLRLDFEINRKI